MTMSNLPGGVFRPACQFSSRYEAGELRGGLPAVLMRHRIHCTTIRETTTSILDAIGRGTGAELIGEVSDANILTSEPLIKTPSS
jgi:hypothetical protein